MKYLYGLDLSISCTGIAIFNLETKKPVLITHVKTDPKLEHGERLHIIREYIKDTMLKFPPYETVIEQGFSMHNKATQVLYRVHGVCNEVFHKCEQFYYAPTTVKKAITGNGRASKTEVKELILKKYPNLDFVNEDESDAVGVAVTHLIQEYNMKWD